MRRARRNCEKPLDEFLAPLKRSCRENAFATFPPSVQEALKTPEEKRTPEQKKLADDYAPIIRIDPPKYKEIMTPEQIRIYDGLRAPLQTLAEPV